jgi:Outer membrane protein beta-barrel domain
MKALPTFLLAAALSFSLGCFADRDAGLMFGVQGGLNLAKLNPDLFPSGARRTGVAIGLNMEVPLFYSFSFQPEIMYVQKGQDYTDTSGNDFLFKLDYLEIPLLFKAKFGVDAMRLVIFAGPALGIAVNRKAALTPDGGSPNTYDISSAIATTDVSLHAGFGAQFKVAQETEFFFSGRYVLGVTNLIAGDSTPGFIGSVPISSTTSTLNNIGIIILAGLQFYL